MLNRWLHLEDEQDLAKEFAALSFVVHIVVLGVSGLSLFHSTTPILHEEEWVMEADLFVGNEILAPDQDSLPNAAKAENAAVPETMLPQLSKHVALEESEKDNKDENGDLARQKDEKEKSPEEKEDPKILAKRSTDDNKLEANDALRRLALEKLRKEEKFSKTLQAEQTDAIARLKKDSLKKAEKNADFGGSGVGARDEYRARLQAHVRRCYSVPTAYQIQKADLLVAIKIILSETGALSSVAVEKSSGDDVFDQLAYKAIQDCAPLPAPPKNLAGVPVVYQFKF